MQNGSLLGHECRSRGEYIEVTSMMMMIFDDDDDDLNDDDDL